jgi:hypothetical protein
MRSARGALVASIVFAIVCAAATPVRAQTPYERVSLDTTVGVDVFGGNNVSNQPQVVIDIIGTVQLAEGWQVYVRPWFRLPRPSPPSAPTPSWDTQLYQASLRYERSGDISTRVDAGYIASPIGLGLFDSNPRANPTIAGHASYFTPMLPFDAGGPRGPAIASTYPLGAVVTVSATRWDARAAIVNSAPVRNWILGATSNPSATPVFEAGAGVTPTTGLRLGVTFAQGAYLTQDELAPTAAHGDRDLTLIGFEGDYSVRYTKITGEFVRDRLTLPGEVGIAHTWFVQGTQTLHPRWFVSGREEGTSSPVAGTGVIFRAQPHLLAGELTAGYRATRDFTIKSSYYARESYGRTTWDQQAAVQVVWQKRWW